jgi:hypothetical protein
MKEIKKILKSPFISMATVAKFFLLIPTFLAYLIPLDVIVTGNITAKICEVWIEFNIFCTLVGNGRHFEFFHPPKLPHTTVDILTMAILVIILILLPHILSARFHRDPLIKLYETL